MTIEILMPALSPTMEVGTLAKWHVKEGDTVSAGDVIAEIETDKATMEVEAVDEGTVGKILIGEGTEGVKVNELIAVLLEEGEDASAAYSTKNNGDAAPAPVKEAVPSPQPKATAQAPQSAPSAKANGRVKASPLAKRLAAQAGIDLAALAGSGPGGRIVKADVEAAGKGGAPTAARAPFPAPAEAPVQTPAQMGLKEGAYEEISLGNIRKTIAQRLTVAKRDVPHYYLTIDCEIDKLLKARKDLNESAPKDKDGKPRFKISVNDFVIKACAQALLLVPGVNSSWGGDKIIQHHHADISMAVAIPEGLITPIIWEADEKGLAEISREAAELAGKAKDRKLMPEQYQGGSFSISNLGMFGIKNFTAVINPPHAAILAVGAGEQRPVVKNGALAVATVMTVTLSCDHRVVDGAMGAEFLSQFKRFIEDPVTMLL
jgi:pyruvate dehydrogenase E2 component (dihydrolipoamide acetyltransferase)